MSKLHVGIDVSLDSHHVQFMDEDGQGLDSFKIANNQPGADSLIRKVMESAQAKQIDTVVMGMEATSNLGWHLAHYLKQQLEAYEPNLQAKIHVLNARRVLVLRRGMITSPKTTALMPG